MKKKKNKRTDLFVRELTTTDAYAYSRIANDDSLHQYAPFLEALNIKEAQSRIKSYSSEYEKLYGLFTKSNRLVAVFDVTSDTDFATISYFVGEKYRGNNYALTGIKYLINLLSNVFSKFLFEVSKTNIPSLIVQEKLGSYELASSTKYKTFLYSI